ncbi:hypothetical protein A2160_00725 [Candidatus Beckwithbacteria bacterium RBG_13_42_9]|uniref:Uncharacterized protein n=1 Tax=Candidatus Beckwithbacteria bacterium RBG_13_42_9 TaxID=1797457 RepID=A0A1F5E4P8_9BACT|nr:MAG: hypothetical protein A2160_00725 [Candidatus Beckwithbacteria bacterium RBG_13_42_9]
MIPSLLYTTLLAQEWQTFEGASGFKNPAGEANPGAATFKSLEAIFANVLGLIFALGAIATFVMLIVGGFRYLTSGGDPKATAQAQGTMTWSIAGLLFFIGAWFFLRFIKEFTGVDVTTFKIPGVP